MKTRILAVALAGLMLFQTGTVNVSAEYGQQASKTNMQEEMEDGEEENFQDAAGQEQDSFQDTADGEEENFQDAADGLANVPDEGRKDGEEPPKEDEAQGETPKPKNPKAEGEPEETQSEETEPEEPNSETIKDKEGTEEETVSKEAEEAEEPEALHNKQEGIQISQEPKKYDVGDLLFGIEEICELGEKKKGHLSQNVSEREYLLSTSRKIWVNFNFDFLVSWLDESEPQTTEIEVGIYQLEEERNVYGDDYFEITKILYHDKLKLATEEFLAEKKLCLPKGEYLIKLMSDDLSIFLGDSSVEFTILAKKINDFATSLSIQKKLYLNNKESASIEVSNIKPEGLETGIIWKSSNNSIAKVDENGKVTAKKPGKCRIAAILHNGTRYYCMVYVEDPKFTVKKYTLSKGESRKLKLKKVYQTVKWKSSNPKVAKVDQKGKVTARKKGNAVIKAYVGKNTVSCKIHVEEPKLSSKTEYIIKGKSVKLKVTGTKRKVKWSSSNKKVATVKNGKIKTKKPGKAIITARIGAKKFTCKVIVVENKLKKTSIKVSVKGKRIIEVKKKAGIIKWSSSNKKVATVKNGVVTGKRKGTAVITAKSKHVKYTCKVTVEHPRLLPTSKSISITKGNTYPLMITDTTMKPKWRSSNPKVATVDSKGRVEGRYQGRAVIKAKIGGRDLKCKVQVTARRPNYSVWTSSRTYPSTNIYLLSLKNYGQEVMRIHGNNATLIDRVSAEYNRSMTLVSYEESLRGSIMAIPYLDIAPGEEKYVLFFMDPPTWYDMTTTVYFDFSYDGEEYQASNSYYYGNHYSHK